MSEATKKLRNRCVLFGIISWSLAFAPAFSSVVMGYVQSDPRQKFLLTGAVTFALLVAAIGAINKLRIRSTIWIVLLGLYFAIRDIVPVLVAIAVCTVIDELIAEPVYKHYKTRYKINKEIDKRI